jgi:lipopolysaccharide export LptBFGC system permease protein LptF
VVLLHLVEGVDVLANRTGGMWIGMKLAVLSAVEYSHTMLPPSAFLGLLITGAWMASKGELLAVQSIGFTAKKMVCAWACVVAVLWMTCMGLAEYVVPKALRSVERIYRKEGLRSRTRFAMALNQRPQWVRDGSYVLFLPEADVKKGLFLDPMVYVLKKGVVREIIQADVLVYENNTWTLYHAYQSDVRKPQSKPVLVEQKTLPLKSALEDIVNVAGNPRHMAREHLNTFLQRQHNTGLDTVSYALEKHERVSYATLMWCLFAIAFPWSWAPYRRRTLSMTLGGGAAMVAVFFASTQIGRMMALTHTCSPWLGAWLPAFVCLVCVYPSKMLSTRMLK